VRFAMILYLISSERPRLFFIRTFWYFYHLTTNACMYPQRLLFLLWPLYQRSAMAADWVLLSSS
jgi:hypothetical protein